MFKIVFVVAVFAFALHCAVSSPVEGDNLGKASADASAKINVPANKAEDPTQPPATTPAGASTTGAPKSGASSSEVCLLLVQVSSLALVAKHMMF